MSQTSRSSQFAPAHNDVTESTSTSVSSSGTTSRSRCLCLTEKKWYTTTKRASHGGPGQGSSSGIWDEGLNETPEEAKKAGAGLLPKVE